MRAKILLFSTLSIIVEAFPSRIADSEVILKSRFFLTYRWLCYSLTEIPTIAAKEQGSLESPSMAHGDDLVLKLKWG
jgi:hypothetical protein